MYLLASVHSLLSAFQSSDFLGKSIFLFLLLLSVMSWTLLIQKGFFNKQAKQASLAFKSTFSEQYNNVLHIESSASPDVFNPFLNLYAALKKQTLQILNKNKHFGKKEDTDNSLIYISRADLDLVESTLSSQISEQIKKLEKNLFLLPLVITLAPFLGLLGTVWGILITFSELQMHNASGGNEFVLGGLAMALATTVIGLFVAIPALVAFSYLKQQIHDFETEMDSFCTEMLAAVEMQYRLVDLA